MRASGCGAGAAAYAQGNVPRTPRRELPTEGIFHVTARGVADSPLFTDDVDRLDFLRLLDTASRLADWTCHAYCLLTTHYHLVLETTRSRMSQAMHRLNGVYAHRFNLRHDRRGHLFAGRYSSWVVEDERHLSATCEYVLANPVKAGLAESVGEWPWASVPALEAALAAPPTAVAELSYRAGADRSSSRRRTSSSGTSEKS